LSRLGAYAHAMRFTITQPAGPHEVFAADAFDAQVGKTIPVNISGRTVDGVLTAATVDADGRTAHLTIEVADGSPVAAAVDAPDLSRTSFGYGTPALDAAFSRRPYSLPK
jgi:phage head maturation protease